MENLMGLLRIRVLRGVNLAVRDICTSDPYVVIHMADQKLKTRVVKKNTNPEWNEDLTLTIDNLDSPIKLEVYDRDTLSRDDKMGDADIDIITFIEALKMKLEGLPNGTIITRIQPDRLNCLAQESHVVWLDGNVVQNVVLRLKNVESGEIELQFQWIHIPGSRGL